MPMREGDLRRRLEAARPLSLRLVDAAEEALASGSALSPAALLASAGLTPADVPFSPRVWDAWLGNTTMLRGVKRIDRAPYATHPTRMALLCLWLLADAPEAERDGAAVAALLHDYLEEGEGLTADALAAMRRRFPSEDLAVRGAVQLSEPALSYGILGDEVDVWTWERIAYALQAERAVAAPGGPLLATAALADKLDNLHDLDYISANPKLSPSRRAAKLGVRLGYFLFVESRLGPAAPAAVGGALRDAVASRAAELGIDWATVTEVRDRLEALRAANAGRLAPMIDAYHRALSLTPA